MTAVRPIVIKLGGSLLNNGRLPSIISIVATSRLPVVIVPGGGAFADAVRHLQNENGIDDRTAHRLALVALNEMAKVYFSIAPSRLAPAETLAEISDVLAQGRIPVWLPYKLSADDDAIPQNWSTTSDALAARLAERLGAVPVLLVKSEDIERGKSPDDHAEAGVVDPVFPEIVARAGLNWGIIGPSDDAKLAALVGASLEPA